MYALQNALKKSGFAPKLLVNSHLIVPMTLLALTRTRRDWAYKQSSSLSLSCATNRRNGGSGKESLFTFWLWRGVCESSRWRFPLYNMPVAFKENHSNAMWSQILQRMHWRTLSKVRIEWRTVSWFKDWWLFLSVVELLKILHLWKMFEQFASEWLLKVTRNGFRTIRSYSFMNGNIQCILHRVRRRRWIFNFIYWPSSGIPSILQERAPLVADFESYIKQNSKIKILQSREIYHTFVTNLPQSAKTSVKFPDFATL